MGNPIVYVGKYRLASENVDVFRKVAKEVAQYVEENEPQLLAYIEYMSEDGPEASTIQIHPDSESMETHLEVAGAKFGDAMALMEDVKIDLYGALSESLRERLTYMAQTFGVSLTLHQSHAGFARLHKS